VISRRDAAIRLDIPLEMATRHGIPARVDPAEVERLDAAPPPWLAQSRRNRTGAPVWVPLECAVCGYREVERPKKWWPEWTYLACAEHDEHELPAPGPGLSRSFVYGIGSRFNAAVDAEG
jgi:hypothetical protein